MKYQWPASRLSEKEMNILFKARLALKKPITKLIVEAVYKTYKEEDMKDELADNTRQVSE